MLYLYIHLATCVRANSFRLVHITQYSNWSNCMASYACFLTFYCDPYFFVSIHNFCLYLYACDISKDIKESGRTVVVKIVYIWAISGFKINII